MKTKLLIAALLGTLLIGSLAIYCFSEFKNFGRERIC